MRSYATSATRASKNYKTKPSSSYQRKKERATRTSNEWDIRLDVLSEAGAQNVVNHVLLHKDEFIFVMVSGLENPDKFTSPEGVAWKPIASGSEELHVHIGVVLNRVVTREQVLKLVKPLHIANNPKGIYCTPRCARTQRGGPNTYVGWICHHSKANTKDASQPGLRLEHGMLPMDSFSLESLEAVDRKLKKFGNPVMKERFKYYQDALQTSKEITALDEEGEEKNEAVHGQYNIL